MTGIKAQFNATKRKRNERRRTKRNPNGEKRHTPHTVRMDGIKQVTKHQSSTER